MTAFWSNTTSENITKPDIVIFMGEKNYEFCKEHFPVPKKYKVWDVPDLDDKDLNGKPLDIIRETECIKISEEVYKLIKEKTDNLIEIYKLNNI